MKIRVIGWTDDYDSHFGEGEHSFAANEAIMEDIRLHGYEFTGWDHQETRNCVPVLSDGKVRSFSQRGWGGLMGEAYGLNGPMDYCKYAFNYCFPPEACTYPEDEREITRVVWKTAERYLSDEELDLLFDSGDWALFPRKEGAGELELVELPTEEAEEGYRAPLYLLPSKIYEELIETDPYEEFLLSEEECTFSVPPVKTFDESFNIVYREGKERHITLIDRPEELRYIAPGDTVRVGGETYLVKDVDRYRDVPEEIRTIIAYGGLQDERYERAKDAFMKAPMLLDITLAS